MTERMKAITTKPIIECLLRLDEFRKLPLAIQTVFKKYIALEYRHRTGHTEKIVALSAEEQRIIEEYSARYMPAIKLNLEQAINGCLISYRQECQAKNILPSISCQVSHDTFLLLLMRSSHVDDLKSVLPMPLNV